MIGLANAGGDTINSIKQAAEFGIVKGGQKLAGLLVFASDVNALGLPTAQGLTLTETWYWDMNDANRAWTKRWQEERKPGKWPTMVHAGVYSGILHYLKARVALGGNPDGKAVTEKMKAMPTDDVLFGKGTIDADRPQAPRRLSVRGEEAGGVQASRRLLQAASATIPAKDAFRRSEGQRLLAGQELMLAFHLPLVGRVAIAKQAAGGVFVSRRRTPPELA